MDQVVVSLPSPKSDEESPGSRQQRQEGSKTETVSIMITTRRQGQDGENEKLVNRKTLILLGIFVAFVLLCVLTSLVVHWYSSLAVVERGWGFQFKSATFGILQTNVLSSVKGLWEIVNQSLYDNSARDYVRNLSKINRDTCYSAICVHTSLTLLESMEWKIDPCEDFYRFSCGGWILRNPPDRPNSVTDHFAKINDRVIQATQRIVKGTNSATTTTPDKGMELARLFYNECIDVDRLESEGLESINRVVESYGGWPILSMVMMGDKDYEKLSSHYYGERESPEFSWLKLVAGLQRLSIPSILSLEIKQDNSRADSYAIFVVEPAFFLNKEYLVNPSRNLRLLTAYKQYIIDVADEFIRWKWRSNSSSAGKEVNEGIAMKRMDEIAESIVFFEVSLANIVSNEDKRTLKSFKDIEGLQNETNFNIRGSVGSSPTRNRNNVVNWKVFLDYVFEGSTVKIGTREKVIVHDMVYVQRLVGLLEKTPTETLANYLIWRLVVKFMTGATKALRRIHSKFYLELYGEQRILDRNQTCALVVNTNFALAVGSEFIKDSFESSLKKEVEDLTVDIKVKMEQLLRTKPFVPHLLRLAISRKLAGIKACVGFPTSFSNTTFLEQFYEQLDIKALEGVSYIEKNIKLGVWLFLRTVEVLRQPFDTECWGGSYWSFIGEAYAYYDTARNTINLPIGLLQSPFYYQKSSSVPSYMSYGGLGTIIGHEFTHSLNIEGWIKSKLALELETLLDCLISSYSETDITELGSSSKVDGYRTRSENLADHFGLASAYYAYQQHTNNNRPKNGTTQQQHQQQQEQSLPGLEIFSSSQMFFINFANMWCDSQSKESLYDEVESSTHTPSKYRVLGALKNSKDFSETWNCAPGSKMNPTHKCNLF